MNLCTFLKLAIIAVGLVLAGVAVWCFVRGDRLIAALWMLCAHLCVNGVAYRTKP